MLKTTSLLGAIAALVVGSSLMLAQPAAAADGCGPNKYRGFPRRRLPPVRFPGRIRNGYAGPYRNAYRWNGCPPGYWRGPWGHCRDTPYHGRLPNGGWKS